ncbi:MAG: hypothetical protein RL154_475 [Pseudomonadota bacterium]|jgi:nitrate reductase NapAB chaperone NapD
MFIAGLLIIVEEEMAQYVTNEILRLNLAEIPNVGFEDSFVCIIEADNKNMVADKISKIKLIDSVVSVAITYEADEDDASLDL